MPIVHDFNSIAQRVRARGGLLDTMIDAIPPGTTKADLAAELQPTTDADRDELLRRAARERMLAYVDYLQIGFWPALHHRVLIEHLEKLEHGDIDRLMVIMPPGSAKSTYVSALFPAWFLGRNPEAHVIAASNTHDLAESFGRRVRNYFATPEHRAVFGFGLAKDSQAADSWATERGGMYYAAGVGSAIAGRRGDLGLIDDPVKSREEADSDRVREKTWGWWLNDFKPRLKPGARQGFVTTRWHEDDLAGRILMMEASKWTILHLKMEAGPKDPLGRKPGERLWPDWFTADMVADARRDVRVWNALYQGEPTGEDGDYFKKDWFRVLDAEDRPGTLTIYGASDYAVTEGSGDYTEHGIFGVDSQANIHILDWWRGQESPDVWIEAQIDLIHKYKPACWFGESGPIRRSIEPFLLRRIDERKAWCRFEWLASTADKAARCRPFQALAASGKVWVPVVAHWKADVLGQLLRFPAGMHDDAVDTCSLIGRGLEYVNAPQIATLNAHRQTQAVVSYRSPRRFGRR